MQALEQVKVEDKITEAIKQTFQVVGEACGEFAQRKIKRCRRELDTQVYVHLINRLEGYVEIITHSVWFSYAEMGIEVTIYYQGKVYCVRAYKPRGKELRIHLFTYKQESETHLTF